MHSNFVTPPDFVSTVVIIDASIDQIKECGRKCHEADRPYNVYLYNHTMNDLDWLAEAVKRADVVLQMEGSSVPVLQPIMIGPSHELKEPADYFTK
jgi:hypothetical protein